MKDFDDWNITKRITDQKQPIIGVHERELWWVSIGINVSVEINGKHKNYERPAIVIKRFNKHMIWIVPTTSQIKDTLFHEKFLFNDDQYFAAFTQLRLVSTKRLLRKTGMISKSDYNNILKRIIDILQTHEDPH